MPLPEYSNPSLIQPCGPCAPPICEPQCSVSVVHFPKTLTRVHRISHSPSHGEGYVKITTECNHNFTLKYTPVIYIMDSVLPGVRDVNGKYTVCEILSAKSFLARASEICDTPDLSSTSTESSDNIKSSSWSSEVKESEEVHGWVYVPRIGSPHQLAEMVQDYLNQLADPPIQNAYACCFDDKIGRFIFTRSYGLQLFDVLAGSDKRSIMSSTMGYSRTDYMYGMYNHLNQRQTRLPSDLITDSIRPDIVSETVGESASVSVCRGNYLPDGLAKAITVEMQRPLVIKCENDLLVAQILGQNINIHVPQGMYDPQNLIDSLCDEMSRAFITLANIEDKSYHAFRGSYNIDTGAFCIESTGGERFGLMFSKSTIGGLLGFECVNLTGHCVYSSMTSVFFPITNRRFTDQVYHVSSHLIDATFRFTKTGAFQSPIVLVQPVGGKNDSVRVFSWTRKLGGSAHGFQVGDIVTIEGDHAAEVITNPPFVGSHVVQKVCDAFSYELCIKFIQGPSSMPITKPDSDHECSSSSSSCCGSQNEDSSAPPPPQPRYIASHWFQPFSLFFPGVCDNISRVVGFPECVSGCVNYMSPLQWNMTLRNEVYINIQQLSDTDYGRICKTTDSGPVTKYGYNVLNSFVRIPLSSTLQGLEFGILASSSFSRRKRFTFSSVDLYEVAVSIVDDCGNLINFNGRENSLDLRILVEQ